MLSCKTYARAALSLAAFMLGYCAWDTAVRVSGDLATRCVWPCHRLLCWEESGRGGAEPCDTLRCRVGLLWRGLRGPRGKRRPLVYSGESLEESNYGRPGLAHVTLAGHVHHGMRDIELWRQVRYPLMC